MLKFLDNVKIKSGFYEGLTGIIIDTTEDFSEGAGIRNISYAVALNVTPDKTVLFSECYLEKIDF